MPLPVRDKRIQESLLRKEDITLIDVIKNCKAAEITTAQATIMHKGGEESEMSVSLIRNKKGRRFFPPKYPSQAKQYKDKWKDKIENCKFCSYTHYRGSCPAYNKTCSSCNKKGHFAKSCFKNKKNKTVSEIKATDKKAEKTSDSDSSCDMNNFFIGAVNDLINLKDSDDWAIDLLTNETMITYKIDTGAQTNILPYQQFLRLAKRPKLNKTKVTLTAYNDSAIPVKGSSILNVKHKDKTIPILFIIADIDSQSIIGLKSSTKLDLIRRIDTITQVNKFKIPHFLRDFSDCFGSLGCFSKVHHIHTDPDIKPSVNPPRRVPLALES